MKDLDPDIQALIAGNSIHTAHLFKAMFANKETGQLETYYATDNAWTVNYGGVTYPALGHFLSFEGAEETSDMAIATAKITLSGVEAEYISAILSYNYINRELSILRIFFDENGVMRGSPEPVFAGPMDEPSINDDPDAGTLTVMLTASNHFAAFERTPGRHTNHQEQQAHFLGDRFFELVGNYDKSVVWGKA